MPRIFPSQIISKQFFSGWTRSNAAAFLIVLFGLFLSSSLYGEETQFLSEAEIAAKVPPPYQLDQPHNASGVWTIKNLDGNQAGYIFETKVIAAIPGFAGHPVNLLISLNHQGELLNVEILHHNEPIFVSGLDSALFHQFVSQYRGLSIFDAMSVGVPYGKVEGASSQIYLDGVTKATASVRIAHETLLAAAYGVIREKMGGLIGGAPPEPLRGKVTPLAFSTLQDLGIISHHTIPNHEVQSQFIGTEWENDDEIALNDPDGLYLDLWLMDIGPAAVAHSVLDQESIEKLDYFLSISPQDEPLLVLDAGRHGLVSEQFVRNTEPDLLGARQGGLPVAIRDADLDLRLKPEILSQMGLDANFYSHELGGEMGGQLVMRASRRLGFNPTEPLELIIKATREHGSFMPTSGSIDLSVTHQSPAEFFKTVIQPKPPTALEAAIMARKPDLIALGIGLLALSVLLMWKMNSLAAHPKYRLVRLGILASVIGFVGWWGQGQLSVVTVLGTVRALILNQSLEFLLFDPFSLMIWIVVIAAFFYWGRGFFCGWLCPYGAMQEITHFIGEKLGIKTIKVPARWDRRLKKLKYVLLGLLILMTFYAPAALDIAVEVEPFKTAVTTYFIREWYFTIYALGWLILGLFVFKGFCRYVCPLGAFMAIGNLLRTKSWIKRRPQCGSPCQLCNVRCKYQAIEPSGKVAYSECFQCLDCVTIYEDKNTCVPLVLLQKGKKI